MALRSIIDPPPASALANFNASFGQRFLVTVDTEEEFDWNQPISRDGYSLDHLPHMRRFQAFCEDHGIAPLYLVDWPIVNSRMAVDVLGHAIASGRAEVGVQLHPWVNPPFEEVVSQHNSFTGNLPKDLQQAKFTSLRDAIEENFGVVPLIYRAGRYGLGRDTTQILQDGGIAIDSSVRSKFDYSAEGGPDYRAHPLKPYWVDDGHNLLELPLTSVFWGMLRRQGDWLYPALWRMPKLRGLLSKLCLLERIPLTPEGVSVEEAIRGIDIALDDGLPLLVFSFHSPSLHPGHTPYVHNESDLEALYDWWERCFSYLKQRGVEPTSVSTIMDSVER